MQAVSNMEINEPVIVASAGPHLGPSTNSYQSAQQRKLIAGKKGGKPNKKKSGGQQKFNQYHHRLNRRLEAALKQVSITMNEVKELQERIKANENNSTMEIEKPKFSTTELGHPLNFIEDLTTYFEKIPIIHRTVDTAIDCLYGDAKNWADIYKARWSSVEDFKKGFVQQYWGTAEQNLLRRQIISGHWDRSHETMSRHFMCLVSQARWLPNQIPEQELVYDLMRHFPKAVQIAWCVIKNKTLLEATEFLRKMDDVELQFGGKKTRKQRQRQQKKYIIESKREYRWTATKMGCVEGDSDVVSLFKPYECIDLCNDS